MNSGIILICQFFIVPKSQYQGHLSLQRYIFASIHDKSDIIFDLVVVLRCSIAASVKGTK